MTPVIAKITELSVVESLGVSLLGFAIVFFVLIVLAGMIRLLRAALNVMEGRKAVRDTALAARDGGVPSAPVAKAAAVSAAPVPAGMAPAKGSVGEVKLHDVDDKTAALLMAIVADKLNAPLNELRFISIKERK